MNSFLPVDYKVPQSNTLGNFMKLQKGENRIRILSESPTFGWEYWTTDDKPKRLKERPTTTPADIRINEKNGKPERVSHFWALVVWNYAESAIAILEITQNSLQTGISKLSVDADYGHPGLYDIKINRSGEGLKTEYSIIPVPPKPLEPHIKAEWEKCEIKLESLFEEHEEDESEEVSPPSDILHLGNTAEEIAPKLITMSDTITWAAKTLSLPEETIKTKLEEMRKSAPLGEDGKPQPIKMDFLTWVLQKQALELEDATESLIPF